jgi:hypothetical protein
MPGKRLSSPSRDGREPAEAAHRRGLARHGKARVAPTAELLEDVVRSSRMASSEALSWWCPLALHHFLEGTLHHFLEGVQERCPQQASQQGLHRRLRPARRCRAPVRALSLKWEGSKKAPPPWRGRKRAQEGSPPRPGKGRLTKEGTSP